MLAGQQNHEPNNLQVFRMLNRREMPDEQSRYVFSIDCMRSAIYLGMLSAAFVSMYFFDSR
jgi:hypothetical protein